MLSSCTGLCGKEEYKISVKVWKNFRLGILYPATVQRQLSWRSIKLPSCWFARCSQIFSTFWERKKPDFIIFYLILVQFLVPEHVGASKLCALTSSACCADLGPRCVYCFGLPFLARTFFFPSRQSRRSANACSDRCSQSMCESKREGLVLDDRPACRLLHLVRCCIAFTQ